MKHIEATVFHMESQNAKYPENCLLLLPNGKVREAIAGGEYRKMVMAMNAAPIFLHFKNNDEIKPGDWCHNPLDNNLVQLSDDLFKEFKDVREYGYRKVIASTNKSLGLPTPQKGFESIYANVADLRQVIIEATNHEAETGEIANSDEELKLYPKVSDDNVVTIKPKPHQTSIIDVIEEKLNLGAFVAKASTYIEVTDCTPKLTIELVKRYSRFEIKGFKDHGMTHLTLSVWR